MCIEMPDKVPGLCDVTEVSAEQAAELLGRDAFADTLGAAQDDRYFASPIGVLNGIGHPVEKIVGVLFVAVANIVAQMGKVETAIASVWFAAVSSPQVQSAVFCASGCIYDTVILASVGMIDPPRS